MYFREPREPSKTENEQMRIGVHLAEIAINRSRIEQALRGSEERFRNLVDQAVDAFFIMEPDGTIVDVNRQACESLDYTRGELLSMRVEDFEAKAEIVDTLNEWRQEGKFTPITLNGSHRRKDGTTFPVELRLGAIHSGDNVLVLAVARDQTERKWLEDQFTQAQKMRAIGGLAGGIAHEFNNILTPLIGYTNLAQNRLNREDEAFKDLEIVKKAADRARDLVAQILLFSRKKEGERKPLQVDQLAKEVLMLFSSVLPKSIVIAQKVDPDLSLVSADPTQLHVLLMNLFANANQAMPDGGVLHLTIGNARLSDFEITPRRKVSGHFVHIQVKDTGVGMDEATVARIFEPFFTTKELGQGTGMGLSSVYGIVKNHDGYIMVDSQEGVGTTFDVYLPAIDTELAATHELVEQDNTGRESILFVDDEEDITQLGKYGLQRLGYSVTAVTNPKYALQLFRENADGFDLVATDQVMPQMNGDALVRAIRDIRTDIPIIISTGFDRKFADGELEELGVDKLLLKPFDYEELGRAIREVLDAHYMKEGAKPPHSDPPNLGDVAGMGPEAKHPAPAMKSIAEVTASRISVIESEDGIVIEISGPDTLNEEDKQKLLSMYAQAKKNGKHTVVQCESGLYEFLKVTGFDKFLELSVLQ
jgi:PAS domain S-box-containing protein